MKKTIIIAALIFSLPLPAFSQDEAGNDKILKAEVTEIIEERIIKSDNLKAPIIQQNLRLRGLEGEIKNQEIVFSGISELEVLSSQRYETGDKVLVAVTPSVDGELTYYIVDYVRSSSIWWLLALFVVCLLIVGKLKGLRSLIALALTFLIIIKFIIPQILSSANPLLVTLFGSFLILLIIIYLTEGLRPGSHLAVVSIFISLMITVFLSWLFVSLSKLSGGASEDVLFLFNIDNATINLQGLLLSGIIIGALGVLDDVVISQIASVEQLAKANPTQKFTALFQKAYAIGISHISSMTNTLFLAYAGVSLPLLILFTTGESAFSSFSQAINTELVSTEIVRALTGSIGLILSVPISTSIAAWWYGQK